MAPWLAIPLFFVSLAVTLAAARRFAQQLDVLGLMLGLPEALVGLLTALAADGPEISSAMIALAKGAPGASLGVIVGSNVFNLAAMVGLSALLAGSVRVSRDSLALEGVVAVLVSVVVVALIAGGLTPAIAVALLASVLVPYVLLLGGGERVALRAPLPRRVGAALARAVGHRERSRTPRAEAERAEWRTALLLPPLVGLILLGSAGMVQAALALGDRWHASRTLVGVLVLAPLTSIPNAVTAVRLGRARRGTALVSETFNSNTINLVAGVALPAVVVSIAGGSTEVGLELAWMMAMTVVALLLLAAPRGIGRRGGSALIALYVVFVAFELAYSG